MILTTAGPVETQVDVAEVNERTGLVALLIRLAQKHWGLDSVFRIRRDQGYLFPYMVVRDNGDTLHLR